MLIFDILKAIKNYGQKYISSNLSFLSTLYTPSQKLPKPHATTKENGVYLFFDTSDKSLLYVGQSSNNKNGIYTRARQHLNLNDSGAIFRKKLMKSKKMNAYDATQYINNKTTLLMIIITLEKGSDKELIRFISFLESYIIGTFKPQYNYI